MTAAVTADAIPWATLALGVVLKEGVTPNLGRLLKVWDAGHIAVMFFDVEAEIGADYVKFGRGCFGWKGGRIELARMKKQDRTRYINGIGCEYAAGKAVARWLRRSGGARLIVFVRDGVLCLNFDPDTGFTVEPGT